VTDFPVSVIQDGIDLSAVPGRADDATRIDWCHCFGSRLWCRGLLAFTL